MKEQEDRKDAGEGAVAVTPDAAAPEEAEDAKGREGEKRGADEGDEPRRSKGSRRTIIAMAAVTVLAVVGAIAMATVAASLKSDLDEERGDRQDVASVASRFAEALLTYDYTDLDTSRQQVLALSTGNFRTEYEEAFDRGLGESIQQAQSQSEASVQDVFVGDLSSDSATVIAVVDSVNTGAGGPRETIDTYLRLSLVKAGEEWKVDGVINLNFSQSRTLTPEGPEGGPATTAPAVPPTTAPAP